MATNNSTNKITNTVSNAKIVYPILSYKIVGVLFRVYNGLGSGYQEKYYSRAIEQEFREQKIKFDKEAKVDLEYNGKAIGKYFIDFIIENKIALEVKTVPSLGRKDFKQISAYLKSTGLKLGIIANFHANRVNYYRVLNSRNNL